MKLSFGSLYVAAMAAIFALWFFDIVSFTVAVILGVLLILIPFVKGVINTHSD